MVAQHFGKKSDETDLQKCKVYIDQYGFFIQNLQSHKVYKPWSAGVLFFFFPLSIKIKIQIQK